MDLLELRRSPKKAVSPSHHRIQDAMTSLTIPPATEAG
jgi:hypothetical protein